MLADEPNTAFAAIGNLSGVRQDFVRLEQRRRTAPESNPRRAHLPVLRRSGHEG